MIGSPLFFVCVCWCACGISPFFDFIVSFPHASRLWCRVNVKAGDGDGFSLSVVAEKENEGSQRRKLTPETRNRNVKQKIPPGQHTFVSQPLLFSLLFLFCWFVLLVHFVRSLVRSFVCLPLLAWLSSVRRYAFFASLSYYYLLCCVVWLRSVVVLGHFLGAGL